MDRIFRWIGLWIICGVLVCALAGCQIVEPEKRAYPLVLGIDEQDGEYQVYFGMAGLASMTGQGKGGEEDGQGGSGQGALLFTGKDQEEILDAYEKSQELYLDVGHVQAVIFGQDLCAETDKLVEVLKAMEQKSTLGNAAYVYRTRDLAGVMETNGNQVESLGEYLSGIYENRTDSEKPLILRRVYSTFHNEKRVEEFPMITLKENGISVQMESSGKSV